MGYTALDDFIVTRKRQNSDEAQKSLREITHAKATYEHKLRKSHPNWRMSKTGFAVVLIVNVD